MAPAPRSGQQMKAPAPKGKGKAPLQAAGGQLQGRVRKRPAALAGDGGPSTSQLVPHVPIKAEKDAAPVVTQEVAKKQKKQKKQAAVKQEAVKQEEVKKKKPKAEAKTRVIRTKEHGDIVINKGVKKERDEGVPGHLDKKLGDNRPLRLLLVGHNPSNSAWKDNHYYSSSGNWMWPNPRGMANTVYPCVHGGRPGVLNVAGIVPERVDGPKHDNSLPDEVGVGFMDVGSGVPGNNSENFTGVHFEKFIPNFYKTMERDAKDKAVGMGCWCMKCGWPAIVAFVGKKQYAELMNYNATTVPGGKRRKNITTADVKYGRQTELPPGWPCPGTTEVWVCSSTSGSAAFKGDIEERFARYLPKKMPEDPKKKKQVSGYVQRFAPYILLGERLKGTGEFEGQGEIPWPRFIDCLEAGPGGEPVRRQEQPAAWKEPRW